MPVLLRVAEGDGGGFVILGETEAVLDDFAEVDGCAESVADPVSEREVVGLTVGVRDGGVLREGDTVTV